MGCLKEVVIMGEHVKVIIARYREDVVWAEELGYDYVVYNKGGD